MIEITTGVIFLMSSMYSSGHAVGYTENIANSVPNADKVAAVVQTAMQGPLQVAHAATDDVDAPVDEVALSKDPEAMEAYLRKEFADAPILVDIARCESNYHQFDENGNIVRGRVNPEDVGVMQINEKYQGDTAKKLGMDIYTTAGNVAYAKHLFNEQGSAPWIYSSKCWGTQSVATIQK